MRIIKGRHQLNEALKSQIPLDRLIVARRHAQKPEFLNIIQQAHGRGLKVQLADDQALQQYAGTPHLTSEDMLIAIALPAEQSLQLADLINKMADYPFVIVLDHLQDPYNFGAIIRTAEILGVRAIVYAKDRGCQITPGVIKVAAGALYHLSLVKVVNIADAALKLEKAGYWLYGADANGGDPLEQVKFQAPMALVVGNEEKGLSSRIQTVLHQKIHIPARGQTNSLNVSVATGIITYVAANQIFSK